MGGVISAITLANVVAELKLMTSIRISGANEDSVGVRNLGTRGCVSVGVR